MNRKLRAVLVGVPTSDLAPGQQAFDAIPTVCQAERYLNARFAERAIEVITTNDGAVTRQRILDAIARVQPASNELFVVLFFGHGIPASALHQYQSWALSGTEEFTDSDLARVLAGFPAGVDSVVVSICCYGLGIFIEGPNIPPPVLELDMSDLPRPPWGLSPHSLEIMIHQLDAFSQQFATRVTQLAPQGRDTPLVCLAASGLTDESDGYVFQAIAKQLVTEMENAASASQTYADLRDRFDAIRATGRTFHVAARPTSGLARVVLDIRPS